MQWRAHATDATRATVLIATANVIKTLALMRASQVRQRERGCFMFHPPLLHVKTVWSGELLRQERAGWGVGAGDICSTSRFTARR